MKNHFFSHLVEIQRIDLELDDMGIEEQAKEELRNLIHENIYHAVFDALLSELSEEDKKIFLTHLINDDHDNIWNFVNNKIENIEDKIKNAAEAIKKELHKDIDSTKHAK